MLNVLIIANWIVLGLVGSAMVYALALAVYDLVADLRRSKIEKANSDLWQQMLLDDVYYRDSYAELFSSLVWRVERETADYEGTGIESIRNLLDAVKQFIEESKVLK